MQPDPDYLRQHYALLSDEALLEIDRTDLVDVAQKLYDAEVAHRNLVLVHDDPETEDAMNPPADEEDRAAPYEPTPEGERPEWLEDASTTLSYPVTSKTSEPPAASDAFDALHAAGIPCFLDLCEVPPEKLPPPTLGYEWRLLVPGRFSFRAMEVVKKEIYNVDFEASWKAHLESLTDGELAASNPREEFCGLFDQIERANRAYNQELARRRGNS